MASDKKDLEDEMSRFEREIAGQLPPPPKLPNFANQNTMHSPQMTMPPQHSHNLPNNNAGPMPQPPSFPGVPPPMPPFSSSPQQFHPNQVIQSNVNMQQMPQMMPQQQMHSSQPSQMPLQIRPQMGMSQIPPMIGGQQMQVNQVTMPPMPPTQHHGMGQMQVPSSSSMPPHGMSMMQTPMQYSVPMQIQPPTVPLDDFNQLRQRPVGNPMAVMVMKGETSTDKKKDDKKKKVVRLGGGEVWEDESLAEWNPNDFRIFVGDLGNEVTDDQLYRAFSKYPSLLKAKVIRDKKSQKTKGYGFVSFKNPQEYLKAMREMNGKYLGNRPIKLRKSTWKDRNIEVVKKKDREKKKLGLR